MPAVPLTTAIATYGHTKALKDGTIQSERVALEHREVSPITSAFRQMVRTLAFDRSSPQPRSVRSQLRNCLYCTSRSDWSLSLIHI